MRGGGVRGGGRRGSEGGGKKGGGRGGGSGQDSRISRGEACSMGTAKAARCFSSSRSAQVCVNTSAGRCPTARAFRLYVEQLHGGTRIFPGALPQERRDQIEDSFAGVSSPQQFLERTSHVLSLISSGVGVAMAAQAEIYWLDHIHFSRISTGRVLAVVVTKSGMVLDRILTLDRDLSLTELEGAAAFLNQNFRGWSIERIRAELAGVWSRNVANITSSCVRSMSFAGKVRWNRRVRDNPSLS